MNAKARKASTQLFVEDCVVTEFDHRSGYRNRIDLVLNIVATVSGMKASAECIYDSFEDNKGIR